MRHNSPNKIVLALILISLSACNGMTVTPSQEETGLLLATSALSTTTCATCAQATQAAALTQLKNNEAAATAEIMRSNAQATFDSANATLGVAQTQARNNANLLAAQIAATAEVARANAQATVNSAGSTQIAAMTQSQYNLQSTQAMGTQRADANMTEQIKNDLAASTQTAVANMIATQTQVAVATSQWYTDQARQREEQRQGPIDFLWMWCLPMFIVLFAGLALWGFWRWLRIPQANQRILESPINKLPMAHHLHEDPSQYLESDFIDTRHQLTDPEDHVDQWVDEVKNQLLSSGKKDLDDNTDN